MGSLWEGGQLNWIDEVSTQGVRDDYKLNGNQGYRQTRRALKTANALEAVIDGVITSFDI